MEIKQAFTYKYETKHFGEMLKHDVVAGQCFKNVANFCKTYADKGRNVMVSLTFGMRTYEEGATSYGYHYLVRDADTGEYSDPQYSRYTFVELHSWTLEDYVKECKEFENVHDIYPAEEFAYHYVHRFKKQLSAAMKFIKSQGYCKLTDAEIRESVRTDVKELLVKPKYGTQEIYCFNIG